MEFCGEARKLDAPEELGRTEEQIENRSRFQIGVSPLKGKHREEKFDSSFFCAG